MLEAFSPPCEKELLLMECVCGGLDFHSRSTVIANPGWRAVFSRKEDREKDEPERDEGTASFTEGEEIPVMGYGLAQKKTLPRPLYTEATLLTAMENCGKEIADGQAREAVKERVSARPLPVPPSSRPCSSVTTSSVPARASARRKRGFTSTSR